MTQSPYRVRLTRGAVGRPVLWVCVNPSIAEDQEPGQPVLNDQTVTKIEGFTSRYFQGHRVYLGNKFSRRATDVRELRGLTMEEAVGSKNNHALIEMLAEAEHVVFAWGPLAKLPPQLRARWEWVWIAAVTLGHRPLCLGVCQDGHPRHPLMVSYDTPPRPWSRPT